MNQFIKPPYENVRHFKYEKHKNNPVNLANVNGIKKMQLRYYPDNEGVTGISFLGTETESLEDGITWIFHNVKERDICFQRIANNDVDGSIEQKVEDTRMISPCFIDREISR